MKAEKVTDELLYKYMPVVDKAMLDRLSEDVEEVKFSKRFERKMKKLIRKEWYYSRNAGLWKFGRKASVFLIAVSISILAALLGITAYGSQFFTVIKSFFTDSTLYEYQVDEGSEEFIPLYITELPEGYVKIHEEVSEVSNFSVYEDNDGSLIIYTQMLADGLSFLMDSEYDEEERLIINNTEVTFHIRHGIYLKAYYEKGMDIFIISNTDEDKEMMINIIKSIK